MLDQAKEGMPLSFDVGPDKQEALRYLGYSGQVLDEGVEDRYAAAEAKCAEFRARGAFRVFPCIDVASAGIASIDVASVGVASVGVASAGVGSADVADVGPGTCGGGAQGCVRLGGTSLVLPGSDIVRHLEGAVAVALLAATLGHEADRAIRREMALSPTDGAILGAAASSQIEVAVEMLHDCVRAWAVERGLRAGDRFSPGYGDLPLSVQPAFLDAVAAGKLLGITTTPANFLAPSKSVTAIVGLFDEGAGAAGTGGVACDGDVADAGEDVCGSGVMGVASARLAGGLCRSGVCSPSCPSTCPNRPASEVDFSQKHQAGSIFSPINCE